MPAEPKDFLPPPPAMPEPTLFDSPSIAAGHVAASYARTRYRQILQFLRDQGSNGGCIFEIAAAVGAGDNQISGRFISLEKDLLILRTGRTRIKPNTKRKCSVYLITTLGLAVANAPVESAGVPPSGGSGGDA